MKIPQKLKSFLWKCCWNILPARENLFKKRTVRSSLCPICNLEEEKVEHSLFLSVSGQTGVAGTTGPNHSKKGGDDKFSPVAIQEISTVQARPY